MSRIAALFVQEDGCYIGDSSIDAWPESRDARQYRGRVVSNRKKRSVVLTGTVTSKGYIAYILRTESGAIRRVLGHRLVGLHFLPSPTPEQSDVCHNDGDPANNHYLNLRWDTHRLNQMDMRRHGTMQDGEKSVTHKLTADQVAAIRKRLSCGVRGTSRRISEEYNVSPTEISRIKNGTRWVSLLEENRHE